MTYLTGAAVLLIAACVLGLGLALSIYCIPPFGEVLLLVGVWLARTGWGVLHAR